MQVFVSILETHSWIAVEEPVASVGMQAISNRLHLISIWIAGRASLTLGKSRTVGLVSLPCRFWTDIGNQIFGGWMVQLTERKAGNFAARAIWRYKEELALELVAYVTTISPVVEMEDCKGNGLSALLVAQPTGDPKWFRITYCTGKGKVYFSPNCDVADLNGCGDEDGTRERGKCRAETCRAQDADFDGNGSQKGYSGTSRWWSESAGTAGKQHPVRLRCLCELPKGPRIQHPLEIANCAQQEGALKLFDPSTVRLRL
eukprot:IDg14177t1